MTAAGSKAHTVQRLRLRRGSAGPAPVQRLRLCEARIPGAEGLGIAVEGALQAVDAVLPEVEFGALEINDFGHPPEVVTGKGRKGRQSGAAGHLPGRVQLPGGVHEPSHVVLDRVGFESEPVEQVRIGYQSVQAVHQTPLPPARWEVVQAL